MKVVLFEDILNSINSGIMAGDPGEEKVICEIEPIKIFPEGFVEIGGRLARVCGISEGDDLVYVKFVDKERLLKCDEVGFSHNITCPHCGNENKDSWDAPDSDDEHQCDRCGSTFSYERHVEISYSTQIVKRNDEITILKVKTV